MALLLVQWPQKHNTHAISNKNGGVPWQGKGFQVCEFIGSIAFSGGTEINLSKGNVFIYFNVIIYGKSSQVSPPILKHS